MVQGHWNRYRWAALLLVLACPILFTSWVHWSDLAHADAGDPLSRIECPPGFSATVYAEGLLSPDGLAFGSDGVLYVSEEQAGRVSRIEAYGAVTPVLGGLVNPEGIAFDPVGDLYVVEDAQGGRLIRMSVTGVTTTLAADRDAPEGVVWGADGTVYITESNVQFVGSVLDYRTHVTAIPPAGEATRILTNAVLWSYAGITVGPDGFLYVTNEASGVGTNDSIFKVDPVTGSRTLFSTGLVAAEGLRFSPDGDFPLYVVEEDLGDGGGQVTRVAADGSHTPFCTGFQPIEDVVLDSAGRLYVSEDGTGTVIRIEPGTPEITLSQSAVPPQDAGVRPGGHITYTLTLTNSGAADALGLVLTDTLPTGVKYVPGSAHAAPGLNVVTAPPPVLVLTGTLPAGYTLTATFGVTVSSAPSGTLLVNQAEVWAIGSDRVTSTATHSVIFVPDLSVAATATPDSGNSVRRGDPITYTIVAYNDGDPASDVVLAGALDLAHVTLVTSDTTAGSLSGPAPVQVAGLGLDRGERVTLTLGVTVTGEISGTIIRHQARITSAETPTPKWSTVVAHVISGTKTLPPDFALAKRADPADGGRVTQGEVITDMLAAYNDGGPATNVVLSDVLPAGTRYVLDSLASSAEDARFDGTRLSVSVPDLLSQSTLTATFRVTVTSAIAGSITNTVTLVSDQTAPEVSNPVGHRVQELRPHHIYLPLLLKEPALVLRQDFGVSAQSNAQNAGLPKGLSAPTLAPGRR